MLTRPMRGTNNSRIVLLELNPIFGGTTLPRMRTTNWGFRWSLSILRQIPAGYSSGVGNWCSPRAGEPLLAKLSFLVAETSCQKRRYLACVFKNPFFLLCWTRIYIYQYEFHKRFLSFVRNCPEINISPLLCLKASTTTGTVSQSSPVIGEQSDPNRETEVRYSHKTIIIPQFSLSPLSINAHASFFV